MLTGKERSNLKAMANDLQPIFQVGKGGITQNLVEDLSNALEAKELVKVTILKAVGQTGREIIDELAKAVRAEAVSAVGNKVVLYRYSRKENIKHLEF
ncbi:MAG TPA: ribosome assembly RNA-binding protein YhbY [Clostridia bacterium]|nr:ribosome assembly RNA-binding protein YhbY [Clostridia bacterium]